MKILKVIAVASKNVLLAGNPDNPLRVSVPVNASASPAVGDSISVSEIIQAAAKRLIFKGIAEGKAPKKQEEAPKQGEDKK